MVVVGQWSSPKNQGQKNKNKNAKKEQIRRKLKMLFRRMSKQIFVQIVLFLRKNNIKQIKFDNKVVNLEHDKHGNLFLKYLKN